MAPTKFFRVAACLAVSALIWTTGDSVADEAVTMKQTIDSAVAYNPTIKAFQEYRQAAEHDLRRARSGWFPRVDARAGWGMEQWSDSSTRSSTYPQNNRDFYSRSEASLVVSQTIWDGLATWYRTEVNQTRLDSAHSRLFDNAEALALDALLAHIEIYRQRRIVTLAELNVQNHRSILRSQMQRQQSGASTMADVTQTQSRLARTEASLAESRAALEVAIANYKRLTGVDVGPVAAPLPPENAYASLEMALASSQSGNLKIKALESDAETAEFQTELDKSPFHPQIVFEMGPTYRYRTESALTDAGGMSFMLRANWNLFDGFYDYYNVKGDKARARQARQEIVSQQDLIAEETAATWAELISAQEQAKFYGQSVQYATRTRDMYLDQFNMGARSLLDVLDAENEVFTSSIQFVTAQQNVTAAKYRLLALGGEFLSTFEIDRNTLAIDTDPK